MSNVLSVLSDESLIQITPAIKDEEGNVVSKGQPVEVTLADFITFLQTHDGWIETSGT